MGIFNLGEVKYTYKSDRKPLETLHISLEEIEYAKWIEAKNKNILNQVIMVL